MSYIVNTPACSSLMVNSIGFEAMEGKPVVPPTPHTSHLSMQCPVFPSMPHAHGGTIPDF
eukprot:1157238-Pelagomonas_calceolata.AAC.3